MRQVRLVLILSENWTMVPTPTLGDLVDMAVVAEAAGMDAVMVSEHVVLGRSADEAGRPANPRDYALPGNQDPATPWPAPIPLLAAVAARTARLRLVAGALISPLRHPLTAAKELSTLDALSGGRLVVQPTVSWHRDEYDALGVPFHRRGAILDEQLQVWSQAWKGSPFGYQGEHFRFGGVWLEPKPARPGGPALWFGGQGLHDALLRRLVRWGDGFNPLGPPTDDELARLRSALASADRDPDSYEYVGGTRGRFPGPNATADIDEALAAVPAQRARGFGTICIKPSQFVDDLADFERWCAMVMDKVASS
ncbi:MAG: TIGR03619 family F420-dependent LLM class oxidoreductase [Acidimicrobiales bacterium]